MKKFEELTQAEKHKLEKVGMLWELYPEMQESTYPKVGFTFYPPTDTDIKNPYERPRFYVEYHTFDGKDYTYKLCQRVFVLPEADYEKALEERGDDVWLILGVEGHPYTLHEGKVNTKNVLSFETRQFLEHTIDALNEKVVNDDLKKVEQKWQEQRENRECKKAGSEFVDNLFRCE